VTAPPGPASLVGNRVEVDVGAVAHGGHCVARHEGRVIFVRHAIPGERVVAMVTEGHQGSSFLRADAVEIVSASSDRVSRPCPHAGPDACGGCDFQHVRLDRQRSMLADVVAEQLQRLAGIALRVEVEAVPGDSEGLRWRTRVRFAATPDGRPGLRKHRSHAVVAVDDCRIASTELPRVDDATRQGSAFADSVLTSTGDRVVLADRDPAPVVTERAIGRTWRLQANDFWQVHPGAADTLVAAVLEGARPLAGERCWDLYSGVGLLAGALGERVGTAGGVVAVESRRRASQHARHNLADLPQVRCVADRVDRYVRSRIAQGRVDVVVLDPPRSGAGAGIIRAVANRRPRVIAYVACDPAGLARDIATLRSTGYELSSIRAFDIFPMTQHVECVAVLRRVEQGASP
jgi:tRNA/tmRNA/rRNA uracil-C5-methylase (TrmA/RlmC/RlmD family)